MTTKPLLRLAAAALLACLQARAARADGTPASPSTDATAPSGGTDDGTGTQHYDPADLNHDGTVTNKERRQYRRAHRRHGAGAAAAADGQAEQDETSADASAQQHSAAAAKSAAAAADSLKSSLPSDGAGAGLKPGGGAMGALGAAGKGAGALSGAGPGGASSSPGMKSSGDPADPKTPADFALAARSGYSPAFSAAGLKLGPDGRSIVRADGSPATAEDYARLRSGILGMPAALARRPDFFAQVSPQRYSDLKRGYLQSPGPSDPVYKHVGTTEGDRDFVHTASCEKMSGDCNANVEKPSYKKGDFVAPGDLDRMWSALQKEIDEDDSSGSGSADAHGAGDAKTTRLAGGEDPFDGTPARDGTAAGSSGAGRGASAPSAPAAVAARRLWKATARALGFGGSDKSPAPAHGLGAGAAALAALAAAGLVLRSRA